MRIIFLGLSLVAILLASRRFYRFENVGNDTGGLFLLLIGIQLLVTAAIFYEHHESRASKSSQSEKTDRPSPPLGNQSIGHDSSPHV